MAEKTEWDEVKEILIASKQVLTEGCETDALTIEDLKSLHHDACVITAAVIISRAVQAGKER